MQPGGEPGCYFSSFSIEYPIDYAAVGIVYLLPIEINVDVGHRISSMPQGGSNSLLGYVERSGNGRPAVAGYIEYKNKTQEKCNYCTIYQCISGFYKKNVELHLLLILAIDSVIYSFYVTILLCKKAPVFD